MLFVIAILLVVDICVNILTLSLVIKSNEIINDRLSAIKLLKSIN